MNWTLSQGVRRILTVPLLGPVVLTPLMVLGRPGLAWWRYLAFSVGCAYVLLVLGGLAGRWLAARAARRSLAASYAVRGLVRMVLIAAFVVLLFVLSEPSWNEARGQLRSMVRWELIALLVGMGLVHAIPNGRRLEAWVQRRRRR